MHHKFSAGISAPLVIAGLAAVLTGCPTGTVETISATAPTVTAVYVVDANGLPQTALYLLKDVGSTGTVRVSPKAPNSYSAVRVEFDQVLKGDTIANVEDRNAATSCSPIANPSVHLIDVDNGNVEIPSSVCYDPTTTIGGNPSITVTPGSDTNVANVFTCQAFDAKPQFDAAHKYAVKLDTDKIKGANGKALTTPTGSGWNAGTFSFQTTDIEDLAAAYQDPSTGFFHVLNKASLGFQKDLNAEDPTAFRMVPTADPFFIFMSSNVKIRNPASGAAHDPTPVTTSGADAVTIVRKQGLSPFEADIDAGDTIDQRVIAITPTGTWEPGVTYTITVSPQLASDDSGSALGKTLTYEFKVDDAPLGVISATPARNATAVSLTSVIDITYQVPIDNSTVTTDNIKLTTGGAAVPVTVALRSAHNNQVIRITPTSAMSPSTVYSLNITNLKAAAIPVEKAGQALAAYSSTFTTITFGIASIRNAGATPPADTANIDRSTGNSPGLVFNNNLRVVFNSAPTGVDSNTLKLFEQAADGVLTDTNATVTPVGGSSTQFTIATPATYAAKFNQLYVIKALTSITGAGTNLKLEGCTGTGDTCAEVRSFRTAVFAPAIRNVATSAPPAHPDPTTGAFTVRFNFPPDVGVVNPLLPITAAADKAVRLFPRDASGALLAPVPISCTQIAAGTTDTVCTPSTAPAKNTGHSINVSFTTANPALPAATLTSNGVTRNVDQNSGKFAGTATLNFTSSCP